MTTPEPDFLSQVLGLTTKSVQNSISDLISKFNKNSSSQKDFGLREDKYSKEERESWGLREDKTPKGAGYFGMIPMTDNSGMGFGEISRTSELDGKEILYPLVVPGLTRKELDFLGSGEWQNGVKIPDSIEEKAFEFTMQRKKEGKPFFAQQEEEGKTPLPK